MAVPIDMDLEMKRRDFSRLAGALVALGVSVSGHCAEAVAQAAEKTATGRPNLVFVFSDQQSFDMLGCAGNQNILTPHLDQLAAEGVRFKHCISSSPVCTPFRGMLLTGQHPLRSGAFCNDIRIVPGEGRYFGEVLRDAGYACGYVGKWHLYGGDRNRPIPAGPFRYGFDQTFLSNNCHELIDDKHAYYWDEHGRKQLCGDWEPYAQTRQAEKFIEDNAAKPFALFLSWHPPHNWDGEFGYNAPPDLLKLYDPSKLTLRPNVKDTPQVRTMYQGHLALCTCVDRAFGELMAKLRELKLDENTIVVFTSDHGDLLLSHGFRGNKGRPECESVRVPLLIRWPQVLKPRVSELLIGPLDFMPTLLGMLHLNIPETCQGRNLADAIHTANDDAVESLPLFVFPWKWRGVYTRRYTYAFDLPGSVNIYGQNMRFACLYDHQNDPHEMKNLFDAPEQQNVRETLHAQTLAWMKQFGDTGMDYKELMERVMVEEDIRRGIHGAMTSNTSGQGRLKGRPEEVLAGKIK